MLSHRACDPSLNQCHVCTSFRSALSHTVGRTAPVACSGVVCQSSVITAAPRQPIVSGTAKVLAPHFYSASAGLTKEEGSEWILHISTTFGKVDASKLTEMAPVTKDLGPHSLDAVKVMLAMKEVFVIEVPDLEADEIEIVQYAIKYISKTPEAHSRRTSHRDDFNVMSGCRHHDTEFTHRPHCLEFKWMESLGW